MEALQPGVDTWADYAREHFDAFDAMTAKEYKEYADNYETYEKEYYSTRMTPGQWVADIATVAFSNLVLRRPMPPRNKLIADIAKRHFRRATEAVAVMNNLHQARQQFETLCKQLKADG